jgi:D-alanine-D-alanine ligase and related ATP-grasp enzymes
MAIDRVKEYLNGDEEAAFLLRSGDLHAACLMLAAKAQGIQTQILDIGAQAGAPRSPLLRLFLPGKTAYFRRGRMKLGGPEARPEECGHINGALSTVVDSKRGSKDLIRVLGFPTPAGTTFHASQEREAVAWFESFGRAVCLKPDKGRQGTGVFPGLTAPDEFRHAFRTVAGHCPTVVAEEYTQGSAVRFFFVRPKVVGVRIDLPANVEGDGTSSVARLIEAKNEEKRLRTGHTPIHVDEDVLRHLDRRGLTLDSVPVRGERLFLRSVSNGCKGGDSVASPNAVHPTYIERIEGMCNAIRGFNVTAVDTKMRDPLVPASLDNYRILEINSNPGVVPYHFPWEGAPQDVCTPMVRLLTVL